MGKRSKRSKGKNEAKPAGCSFNCFGLKTISQERFEELLHYEEMQEKYKKAYDVVNEDRGNLLEQLKEKDTEIQEKDEIIESQKRDIRYAELTRAQARQDRDDLRASLKLVKATNRDLQASVDKSQKSEIQLEVERNNTHDLEVCKMDITEKLLVASDERDAVQIQFKDTQVLLEDLKAKFDLTNLSNKSRIQDLMQQVRDMRVKVEDLENELEQCKSASISASNQSDPTVTSQMSDPTTATSIHKLDAYSIIFGTRETMDVYLPKNNALRGRKSRSLDAIDLEREAKESQLVALESTNNLLRFQLGETTSELDHLKAMHKGQIIQ